MGNLVLLRESGAAELRERFLEGIVIGLLGYDAVYFGK
jgi:hypothetical protein